MAKFDETAAYRDILDFGFANLQEKKKKKKTLNTICKPIS